MRTLTGFTIVACCLVLMPDFAWSADTHLAAATKFSRIPKAGSIFHDCPDCPDMVAIPEGSFDMGSPNSENSRNDDEGPVHHVKLTAFAMGKTEITRGQFSTFVIKSKYITGDKCVALKGSRFEEDSGRNWRDIGFLQTTNHPASCVSWNDAKAYTAWLSLKTGKQYRLSTEAEWEYAARGSSVTSRYWGDNPDEACGYANVADMTAKASVPGASFWLLHNCTDGYAYSAPVGSFKPNAFGLYDMLGNVTEWTEDSYHDSYKNAPLDGTAWQGDASRRVLRGGSWNSSPNLVRAARRCVNKPDERFSFVGFRVARTLP
ncbi:formylglycine-generating enzyme family protein [Sideroxydans sp. CL21]|uniref:formylglycine-generating enzyme family protein n=1 Tax=Sideroxydans sp. CL21 TaxID=2600596 RepID=UPI0024BC1BFC|nr:formylglycine-generating enzyme family protein [Sideroxydans sp. CL21]